MLSSRIFQSRMFWNAYSQRVISVSTVLEQTETILYSHTEIIRRILWSSTNAFYIEVCCARCPYRRLSAQRIYHFRALFSESVSKTFQINSINYYAKSKGTAFAFGVFFYELFYSVSFLITSLHRLDAHSLSESEIGNVFLVKSIRGIPHSDLKVEETDCSFKT